MKFFAVTLFLCLVTIALVYAVPVDESLLGDNFYESAISEDVHNPHDTQSIFKLKKLLKFKKLLG
ncbi:uncharacterized protein Dwil_GK20031 [Drosophila willistoni]|uniref:Uncharacterized protein n=1 Tax=Drosophila willistoni TaxID=7260 RepID=B4MXE9_DROWI|nr:uncharacterized protein LOC6643111 [Drosophila willistoni]EDW76718.1 uncharacterized protein Dwil_GK20031 [Drosophila willistoni]